MGLEQSGGMQKAPPSKKAAPKTPPMVSLRALRKAHGLTYPELAERIAEQGVSVEPDHLNAVELGQCGVSEGLLAAWARAYKMHPLDIKTAEVLAEVFAEPDQAVG